jgi:predicted RNA-binding Zn-ribbon protein involved in translation (DUF1610 family)
MTVIHSAVSATSVRKSQERECPRCHTRQVVAADKLKKTVKCPKCGAEAPATGRA